MSKTKLSNDEASRIGVLRDFLELNCPLQLALDRISKIPWSSDKDLIVLTSENIIGVLNRFLNGELSRSDVKAWAEEVELREDIGIEPDPNDLLIDVLFEVANPEITYELDPERARLLLQKLQTKDPRN